MATTTMGGRPGASVIARLNGAWHKVALAAFAGVTLAHWAEHLVQAAQIWLLDRPRPAARGALGAVFPWLVSSEWLHYGYAVAMLVGLVALLPAFAGRARKWWMLALVIQVWHHAEHALLLYQAQAGQTLFAREVPTSLLQLVVPRAELHLVYNAIVTIPMVIAIYLHARPTAAEAAASRCRCARLAEAA